MTKEFIDYFGPVVTRREAKEKGLKKYFTGKRCINGHLDQRNTKRKQCLSCAFIWKKADVIGIERRHKREKDKRNQIKEEMAGSKRPDKCDICGDIDKKIRWDHCHYTGKFRGWICTRCNVMLGYVCDSPELLRNMAEYLESNGEIDRKEKKFSSSNRLRRASS